MFYTLEHKFETLVHMFETLEHKFETLEHKFHTLEHRFNRLKKLFLWFFDLSWPLLVLFLTTQKLQIITKQRRKV